MAESKASPNTVVENAQPETFVLFVKTNKEMHQGGFTFFSLSEFDDAVEAVKIEVDHIVKNAQTKDSKVTLEKWGLISSITGEVVEENGP